MGFLFGLINDDNWTFGKILLSIRKMTINTAKNRSLHFFIFVYNSGIISLYM